MKPNIENIAPDKKQKSKYELKQLIIRNSKEGIDIGKIIEKTELTKTELLILKVLIAEEAYLSGEKSIADRLIMEVEQTHPKGEYVVKLLEELKKNKKLFIQKSKSQKKYVFMRKQK